MAARAGGFNTKSPTIKRILQESRELSRHPDPSLTAAPLESNLFEWHFTLAGPPSSPYETGIYHGRIILPPTYPLRPPMFRFLTPSGRFEVNREICLSISGHHEETWQPAWGIRTALCAIRAFMESDAQGQIGGLDVNEAARRRMAAESRGWKCPGCAGGGRTNEEVLRECKERWEEAGGGHEGAAGSRVEVPRELRLAYKEELGEKEVTAAGAVPAGRTAEPQGATSTRSALGGTQVAPIPGSSDQSKVRDTTGGTNSASTSIPGQTTPIQTTTTRPPQAPQPVPATRTLSREEVGVPPWVDKAIVGVTLSLMLMLLRRLLA